MKKMYRNVRPFTHQRKFVPELVPLWLKNRNHRVHAGGLMRGEGGGGVKRGVTQLLRERWAYLRGLTRVANTRGGKREMRYLYFQHSLTN